MKCFKRWKIQKTYVWNECKGSLGGNYFKVVGTKGSVGCWCCKSKLASCILQAVRLKLNVYVWVSGYVDVLPVCSVSVCPYPGFTLRVFVSDRALSSYTLALSLWGLHWNNETCRVQHTHRKEALHHQHRVRKRVCERAREENNSVTEFQRQTSPHKPGRLSLKHEQNGVQQTIF